MHDQGYSAVVEPCLGKAFLWFQKGKRSNIEEVYFSNKATSNFLSRDACMALRIVPPGFPDAEFPNFWLLMKKYENALAEKRGQEFKKTY